MLCAVKTLSSGVCSETGGAVYKVLGEKIEKDRFG